MKKRRFLTIIIILVLVNNFVKTCVEAKLLNIDNKVNEIVSSMTLKEKIGQMIMMDFRQWKIEGEGVENLIKLNSEVAQIINDYSLGGIILFSENIKEIEQTIKLINDMQEVALKDKAIKLPMFIGLDQEGGVVTRLKEGTNLPGNMALGATRNPKAAYNTGYIIGKELNSLGININFAPVIDVNNNPKNPVIGIRSISNNPELVGELGVEIVKGMKDANVTATVKHFPGHGDTSIDTHYGLPKVNKSIEELKKIELKPFQKVITEGVDMIMTAHIQFPKVEKDIFKSKLDGSNINLPATLSNDIIKKLLRKEMNFQGVVITDAMNMKAISEHFGEKEAIKLAIKADVDIILMPTILRSNKDVLKLQEIFKYIIEAIKSNEILEEDINDSVKRIIKLKIKRGIINFENNLTLEEKIKNAKKILGCKEHRDIERKISEESITVVKNENNLIPFKPKKGENILLLATNEEQLNSMKFG